MTKFLKKGHWRVTTQLCLVDVETSNPCNYLDIQRVIENHPKVFKDIPEHLPPT